MVNLQQVRGSGVRLTLPYVLRFSGVWLLVSWLILLVFSASCYLAVFQRVSPEARGGLVLVLSLQTGFVMLALLALAVFSTHRLAGPMIALQRAFQQVRDGSFDRPLRFRRTDPHLGELEASFNEMVEALREKLDAAKGSAPPQ